MADNISLHSNKSDVPSPSKKGLLGSNKEDSFKSTTTSEKSPYNKLSRNLSIRDGMQLSTK